MLQIIHLQWYVGEMDEQGDKSMKQISHCGVNFIFCNCFDARECKSLQQFDLSLYRVSREFTLRYKRVHLAARKFNERLTTYGPIVWLYLRMKVIARTYVNFSCINCFVFLSINLYIKKVATCHYDFKKIVNMLFLTPCTIPRLELTNIYFRCQSRK